VSTERVDVAVVGAGQAGLALSHELTEAGIEHVLLERGRIGQTWRGRWDSFCLVTPNWTMRLPGFPYDGDAPDAFEPRDGIVRYLERYADSFAAPVREGVEVERLERDDDGFSVVVDGGPLRARAVVLATGAYRRPHRPAATAGLPAAVPTIDVEGYRHPDELPDGRVLIVGSGQSGCQVAEELALAGRDVVLACGRAPWSPRRIGDRDFVWWGVETGYVDQTPEDLPGPQARLAANVLASGHGGGHDLHLRTLPAVGVTLAGHLAGVADGEATFAQDLAASVAWGDERFDEWRDLIRRTAADRGWDAPDLPDPAPFDASDAPERLALRDVGAAILTSGFRPEYGPLAPWPGVVDDLGFPVHRDGESVAMPSLFFVGVHFLRTRKSSLLIGVGEDAAVVAVAVARRLGALPS